VNALSPHTAVAAGPASTTQRHQRQQPSLSCRDMRVTLFSKALRRLISETRTPEGYSPAGRRFIRTMAHLEADQQRTKNVNPVDQRRGMIRLVQCDRQPPADERCFHCMPARCPMPLADDYRFFQPRAQVRLPRANKPGLRTTAPFAPKNVHQHTLLSGSSPERAPQIPKNRGPRTRRNVSDRT